MFSVLPISRVHVARMAVWLAVAVASISVDRISAACETAPDLHIEVTSKFDSAPIRTDYTLADLAALAGKLHRDANRALLGFYTGEFGYSIDVATVADQACPTQVLTTVTLRLQHRLIEIGQEAAMNACLYPMALRHYERMAKADEQTVERFGSRAAAMLAGASADLKQTYVPSAAGLEAVLRDHIRAIVDQAVAPLQDARHETQETVNAASDLRQRASSCAI